MSSINRNSIHSLLYGIFSRRCLIFQRFVPFHMNWKKKPTTHQSPLISCAYVMVLFFFLVSCEISPLPFSNQDKRINLIWHSVKSWTVNVYDPFSSFLHRSLRSKHLFGWLSIFNHFVFVLFDSILFDFIVWILCFDHLMSLMQNSTQKLAYTIEFVLLQWHV